MSFPPLFPQATLIGPVVLRWAKASNQMDDFQDVRMRNQTWNLCDPAHLQTYQSSLKYQKSMQISKSTKLSFQFQLQRKKMGSLCHWPFIAPKSVQLFLGLMDKGCAILHYLVSIRYQVNTGPVMPLLVPMLKLCTYKSSWCTFC